MSRYHSVPISCVQKPSAALSWWHQLSRYWWRWLCRLRWWTRRWRRMWRRMWTRRWTRRWRCVQKSLAACPLLVAPLSCQASSVPPVPLPRPVDLCSPGNGTVVQWYSGTAVQQSIEFSTILSSVHPAGCWSCGVTALPVQAWEQTTCIESHPIHSANQQSTLTALAAS